MDLGDFFQSSRDIIAPMSEEDYKAGASAARNKLGGFLRERGLKIRFGYTPPENDDFWYAIQEFAERYGAILPRFGEETVASRNFRESLESYRREQEVVSATSATSSRVGESQQMNSKEQKCRHCGKLFVPKRGKPGYIDECQDCLHEITYPGSRTMSGTRSLSKKTAEKIDQVIADALTEQHKPKSPRVRPALARVLEAFAKKLKRE
jgi:hypothetical protein